MAEQPQQRKHPGGRPRLEFDLRQVEELTRIGCTEEDMAAVLGVSVDTIQRRKHTCPEFRGVIEKGRASLRNSLRRLQVKKALEGNTTMLIWLGKQYLGQTDRYAGELTGKGGAPVDLGFDSILRKLLPELVDGSAPGAPRRALDAGS
jgi:hypothetical protein